MGKLLFYCLFLRFGLVETGSHCTLVWPGTTSIVQLVSNSSSLPSQMLGLQTYTITFSQTDNFEQGTVEGTDKGPPLNYNPETGKKIK